MKRIVLCVFSFLLILLVFCTVVSPKAQEEMMTLVETKKTDKNSPLNTNVGEIAVQWKTSERLLYTIVDGTGWETGKRIAAVPPRYYNDYGSYMVIGPYSDYRYIYTASRDPVPGDTVKAVKVRYGKDTYLLWHPETLGELDKLSNSMTLLNRTENTALIACRNGANPYFEHNMWYTFTVNKVGKEVRIYSLNDVQSFCKALPWVGAIFTGLLCSILMWAGTFLLTRKRSSKRLVLCNCGVITALLGVIPVLYNQFNLPASLMPPSSVLDISHYVGEMQRVVSSAAVLGEYGPQNWITQAGIACAIITGAAILLTLGILLAERKLCPGKEEI